MKLTNNECEVLVVGAGPTGTIITNELLRRGIDVRWVEKRRSPLGTTRAFTVHARTFEMLEHIGIAHKILEVNAFCPGNRFHIDGLNIPQEDMPVLDFRTLQNTRYNFYGKVNQQDLEQILRGHVASQHSVSPEWGTECKSLRQDETGVSVEIEQGGRLEQIRAGYVIGADGVHSIVRRQSGLAMKGDAYSDRESGDDGFFTMSMMDVPLENYQGDADWVNYHFSASNWMLITRLPDGNYRVYISGELEKELQENNDHTAVFQKGLDKFAPGTRLARSRQATTWKIYRMIADDYSADRVFLAGDACHVRSPAGGQGMNCCMQDAFNLGWKLASVIKNQSPGSILASYGIERKPVALQVQGYAERMHNVLFDHSRPLQDRIEDTRDRVWHDECVHGISGLSHNYCDVIWQPECIIETGGAPKAGERAPNARVSATPLLWLHDIYRHTRATLLMLPVSDGEVSTCNQFANEIEREYTNSVKPIIIYSSQIDDIDIARLHVNQLEEIEQSYGRSASGRMFLVRPDLYIGCNTALSGEKIMQKYLSHWYNKA